MSKVSETYVTQIGLFWLLKIFFSQLDQFFLPATWSVVLSATVWESKWQFRANRGRNLTKSCSAYNELLPNFPALLIIQLPLFRLRVTAGATRRQAAHNASHANEVNVYTKLQLVIPHHTAAGRTMHRRPASRQGSATRRKRAEWKSPQGKDDFLLSEAAVWLDYSTNVFCRV